MVKSALDTSRINIRAAEKANKMRMCLDVYRYPFSFFLPCTWGKVLAHSAGSFLNGGQPMATASISGLDDLGLQDLLVLVKQTAERARNSRVLDPQAAMAPDEVMEAKFLYTRARAWPLREPQRRAEPKWRTPGDVEATFFALYDALRSHIRSAFVVKEKNSAPTSAISSF
jgi:hypothetical protein